MSRARHLVLVLCTLAACPLAASAAPVVSGAAKYLVENTFTATLLVDLATGQPLPTPVDLPLTSMGILESSWGDQVGDTIPYEHTLFEASGVATLGPGLDVPFVNYAGVDAPLALGSYSGSIVSVVQDPSDPGYASGAPSSLQSGTSVGSGLFGQIFGGAPLYSDTPYDFEGQITGLPYPVDTEFINDAVDPIEIRLQTGLTPDANADPVIALAQPGGVVRVLAIVPEPASAALLFAAAGAFLLRRRGV